MMKREGARVHHFGITEMVGRGGPDVPFILTKIEGFSCEKKWLNQTDCGPIACKCATKIQNAAELMT